MPHVSFDRLLYSIEPKNIFAEEENGGISIGLVFSTWESQELNWCSFTRGSSVKTLYRGNLFEGDAIASKIQCKQGLRLACF